MDSLVFTVEGVDDTPHDEIIKESVTKDPLFEPKVVEILRQYLQLDSVTSLTQAAQSMVKLLPEPAEPRGWSNELPSLWVLCISVGKQIPYNHPSLVKLVRFVLELRHSPRTSFTGFWDEEKNLRYTSELNLLGETLRDYYEPPFSVDEPEETSTPEFARRWVNVNAFYALLEQLGSQKMDHFCLWTMRDAFQTSSSLPSSLDETAFSCRIAAAAQWIIHSGQALFQSVRVLEETEDTHGEAERLDFNHWRFWKSRFQEAAEKKLGIQDESRSLARKAVDLMDALEKSMSGMREPSNASRLLFT